MIESVRKDNLSSKTPTIQRSYTDTYKPSGMFTDNSMKNALYKLEQAKIAK